jgi:histidinol-phosphate aminotransferase
LLAVLDILLICKKLDGKSIIVIDEAYVEFSMRDSLITYLKDYPNLIVLRTLSKAYGLAGIRCGATIANISIIQLLKKIIAPYPLPTPIVNIAAQQLNLNIIADQINIINQEKTRIFDFLLNRPFVKKIWASDANFLLFEVLNSTLILETCLNNGIVLRDRSNEFNLNNCIRVTIGDPNENTFLMEVLNRV